MNLIKRKLRLNQSVSKVEYSNNNKRILNDYSTKFQEEEYDDFIEDKQNEDYSQVYAEAFYEAEQRYIDMQINTDVKSQQYLEIH